MPEAADLSYERLAAARSAACQLVDSGVLFIHERDHLAQIIARLDAGAHLKHERDQAKARTHSSPDLSARRSRTSTRRPVRTFFTIIKGGSLRSPPRHARLATPGVRSVPAGPGAPGRAQRTRALPGSPREVLTVRVCRPPRGQSAAP